MYGKMGIQHLGAIVSQKREDPRHSDFSATLFATNAVLKKAEQKNSSRDEGTIHILFSNLPIFAKMTIVWPRTPTFRPSQSSIAPPILVLITSDGALE